MIFYLIITYKNTIKYLKYWILGVFISFLEYLPYLISEINNGFYNTKLMLSKSSETGKIIIAKIQALFLFPTNEMSSPYLSGFNNIIGFWISEPSYIYGLIFLILSLIFSAYCLINMLYSLFKFNDKAKTINETVCIKLSKFFILSAFSTILCFFIFKFGEGYFHYLYGLFSISYIPIILFLVQKEKFILHNKKIFSVLIVFLVLNSIAMFGSIDRYIDKFEKRSSEYYKKSIIEFLENRKNK